jgi:hypothetical protein
MDKLYASLIGVCSAELITLPICTVKTIYQSNGTNFKDSVRSIYSNNGLKGFYSASVPAVSAQIFSSVYKLTFFNYMISQYNITNNIQLIYIGIITSLTCIIFTHPIDYIRIRIQNNKSIVWSNVYMGFSANICKAILGGALYLPLREILKAKFPRTSSWEIGVITAGISTTIIHPFDFFKTYLIGNAYGSKIPFKNPYRGLGLNLARIIPHFVIMTEISDKIIRS